MSLTARNNNIGLIRLVAAFMIIINHAPELLDGDSHRELLKSVFGTIRIGDIALDTFFLISGYFITKSHLGGGGGYRAYLRRRIARVYPGYIVAYALCILVVAPLAGGDFSGFTPLDYIRTAYHSLLLGLPMVTNTFPHQHYRDLDGSMWTIRYEFKLYFFVMLAGALGLYRKKQWYVLLLPVFLALWGLFKLWFPYKESYDYGAWALFIGRPADDMQFLFIFCYGAVFYLYRERIVYSGKAALACLPVIIAALFSPILAEPVMVVFGGYILFYLALCTRPVNINRDYDFSYGVYLYAWPVSQLLIRDVPEITPIPLAVATAMLALLLGAASWFLVEKPAMLRIRK